MKKLAVFPIILSCLVITSFAAERTCLVDFFTNTSCGPCATADPWVDSLSEHYGHQLAVLEIHPWWPSYYDPFYAYDRTACASRTLHYQSFSGGGTNYISGVPSFLLDGWQVPWPFYTTASTSLPVKLAMPAPLAINLTVGDSVWVEVDVETPISGGTQRLFVAITESHLYFNAPIDVDTFHNVFRGMLPNSDVESVDLSSIGTQTLAFPIAWDYLWNPHNVRVVAWAQDLTVSPADYSVHNAAWVEWPSSMCYFSYNPGTVSRVIDDATTDIALGGGKLVNRSADTDTYSIKLDKHLPSGWEADFCVDLCYPDSGGIILEADSFTVVDVDFIAPNDGLGYVNLIITSLNFGKADTVLYYVSKNPDILVVDADKVDSYEKYYERSLVNLGESFRIYRSDGNLTGDDLLSYDAVIWFTGRLYGGIIYVPGDTAAIGVCRDSSGNLFMSSQEFGHACFTLSEGAFYPWYYTRFSAQWAATSVDINTVIGADDGPFDDLTFDIAGQNSANNAFSADEITAYGESYTALKYDDPSIRCAGVAVDSSFVYFAFPFEAIAGQENRDTVMARVLTFLRGTTGIDEGKTRKPETSAILSAMPNPFNSVVAISVETQKFASLQLDIFDFSGRRVVNLADDEFGSGLHRFIWDGRDDTNRELSSGVYLARLRVGEKVVTKKLLLVK